MQGQVLAYRAGLTHDAAVDRRLPLIAAVLALLAVPWLVLGGPDDFAPRSWRIAWNLGHVVLFACLVMAAGGVLRPASPRLAALQALALLVVLGLAAMAIEVVQHAIGRDRSWRDVHLSLAGAGLGLLLTPLWWRMLPRVAAALLGLGVAAVLLFWSLQPLAVALYDEWQARRAFPVLADFTTPFELDRWTGWSQRRIEIREGKPAMRVDLSPGRYPGITLEHFPKDWRGYQTLELALYAPTPFELTCRINDQRHDTRFDHRDRYNASYPIFAGRNQIRIGLNGVRQAPEGREMDMHQIDELQCFVGDLDHQLTFWVESVALHPSPDKHPL